MLLSSTRVFFGRTLVLFLLTIPFASHGQLKKNLNYSGFFDSYYFRGPIAFSGGVGFGFYSGDMCGALTCQPVRPSFSAGASYKWWPRVVFGADLRFVLLGATDVVESRGFDYKGTNVELATYARFLLIEDIIRKHSDFNKPKKTVKPYVSLGLNNLYYFANLSGQKFQGWTPMPIMGLGAEIRINDKIHILPDVNYRFMLSDKMDGVEEGNSNDTYLTAMVKVEYLLTKKKKKKKLKEEEVDRIQRFVDGSSDSTRASKPMTQAAQDTVGTGATEEATDEDYLNDLLMQSGEPEEEEVSDEGEYYTGEEEEENSEDSGYDDEGYYTGDDEEEGNTTEEEESSDGWDSSNDSWDSGGW